MKNCTQGCFEKMSMAWRVLQRVLGFILCSWRDWFDKVLEATQDRSRVSSSDRISLSATECETSADAQVSTFLP